MKLNIILRMFQHFFSSILNKPIFIIEDGEVYKKHLKSIEIDSGGYVFYILSNTVDYETLKVSQVYFTKKDAEKYLNKKWIKSQIMLDLKK